MDTMKKKRRHYSLGDLILAVSTKGNRETLAKVAELLERGHTHGKKPRRKV